MNKKILLILTILLAAITFWGCKNGGSNPFKGEETFDKDASYALGMNIGSGLKNSLVQDGIIPNIDEFMKGFKDSMINASTRFTLEDARMMIDIAYEALKEDRVEEAIQRENAFLAENAGKPGVTVTPSGLQYEVIKEAAGPKPSDDSIVLVHYEGRLLDGTLFDNSYEHQRPVDFPLNAVIPGWSEGLQLMNVGSEYKFYIPFELAYGQWGTGPIPPYATLIFTVELLDILN